jgi:sugar lactone lactonase YvrE
VHEPELDRRRRLDVSIDVEQVTAPLAHHGEGPVWHDGWGGLRFVDMLAGDVVTPDLLTGAHERLDAGAVAAAIRPRVGGGMVLATERGFALVSSAGAIEYLGDLWSDPAIRMNDGGCDPDGRFYCGSMAYDFTPRAGRLYRLDPDRSVRVVLEDVTISNGLAWSPDGATAYYADTPTQQLDAFDYSREHGLQARRPIARIDRQDGSPDGLVVDSEGGIWVALWGGGAVRHYSAQGVLLDVIELPVTQVTACTFGGEDLGDLYITTSREQVPDGAQPQAGAIFRARPGVTGQPTLAFAG